MHLVMKKLLIEIEKNGLKQIEVARTSGINQTTLSKYFNGVRDISDEHVIDVLTKSLNFNLEDSRRYLARWRAEEYFSQAGIELPEGAVPMTDNFEYVPLLAKVSCGDGIDMDAIMEDGEHEALIPVPKEYISDKKRTFAFTASGDSMSPEIQNDDTVIVEYSKELSTTKIHLIKYGNEFMFGRVVKTSQGIEIDKTNRTYPPIRIPAGSDFEVCGVVKAVLNLRVY